MDLLSQYNQLNFDYLKHHANHYYSGNLLVATVPATLAMQMVVLDLANDTDHRKCFTKSWQRLKLQKEKFEWTKADSSKVIGGPTLA
eukprot:15110885-Ditylum_brightwellii.AAC.1